MVSIKLSFALVVLMIATSVVAFVGKSASIARRSASSLSMGSFYDITEKDAAGNSVSFSKFKGKVVYGVNVATKCGYTASGYALLSKISKMNGIEVAIFPCNQPGTDAAVAEFCALKGVEGANVFTKADVNGPNARPTYKYLKEKGVLGDVAWNFAGKFLVDKDGNVLPVKSEKDLEAQIMQLAGK